MCRLITFFNVPTSTLIRAVQFSYRKMSFNSLLEIRDPIMPGLTSFNGCSAGSNGIWHERRLLLLLCLELRRRIADHREVLFSRRDVIYFSPPPRETESPSDIPESREGVPDITVPFPD